MPLFWPFVFSAAALGLMVMRGRWLWAVLLYFVTGALWVAHDLARDRMRLPIIMFMWSWQGQAIVFLVWPLRVAQAAVWKWRELRSHERFYIDEDHKFGNLSDAILYARKQAAKLNDRVSISDTANEFWSMSARQTFGVVYFVAPSGEVEKFGGGWLSHVGFGI